MDKKIGVQELALALAERSGGDVKACVAFVKTVFEIVEEHIIKDKLVKIKGLGTFKLIGVSDRESINVNTGERIVIAGHSKLSFTPDTSLKDAVNRPFSDFETTPLNATTSIEEMERIPEQNEEHEEVHEESIQHADSVSEDAVPVDKEEVPVSVEPSAEQESGEADNADSQASSSVLEAETPEAVSLLPSVDSSDSSDETSVHSSETETEAVQEPAVEENSASVAVEEQTESEAAVKEAEEPIRINCSIQENPVYPMSADPIPPSEDSCGKSSCKWWHVVLTLVLMVVSYVCGHYRILDMVDVDLYSENEMVETTATEQQTDAQPKEASLEPKAENPVVAADTLQKDTAVVPESQPAVPEEDPAEIAKYFPQVRGGEYWIVGDAGRIHYMQVGETLYRIAKKELGDQNLVRYLIVFNDFDDPNIIHTGDPIRIPKLVKKQPAEEKTEVKAP